MEKKNTGLIILVVILSLLVLGLGGFIVYDKVINNNNDVKTEEKDNNSDNNKNTVNLNTTEEKTISKESIIELSKNTNLNINTNFDNIDKPIWENLDLSINDNNKLILKSGDKYSIVSSLDEDVVMLYDAGGNCGIGDSNYLILTNKGNVYRFMFQDYRVDEYIENINNNISTNGPLTKINGSTKVLAFTNYYRKTEEPVTCGWYPSIVYTEDEKFMEYDRNTYSLEEHNLDSLSKR